MEADEGPYLTDVEKKNFNSRVDIACVSLDPLLKEDNFSDAEVKEHLEELLGGSSPPGLRRRIVHGHARRVSAKPPGPPPPNPTGQTAANQVRI
jgi:hypothetical protein